MQDYKYIRDQKTQQEYIETTLYGKAVLSVPQLNKGTAFTEAERQHFNLLGKLPLRIENLDEQVRRCYRQFRSYENQLNRNIYLNNLLDVNQVLFYKLISEHLSEMIPTIYTPIVGEAVKQYSHEFRQPRGLYINYTQRDQIREILSNRSNANIDVMVVTDGEGVLGIGDQGIGGMDIPIAKLMVYTVCGGINPWRTLPIFLDVGTNNQSLLDDPVYLGWRHKRIQGDEYYEFIDEFVEAVRETFPKAFFHWEDFGRDNARHILDTYKKKFCTFNDDIQGTGAVTLSALLAAVKATDGELTEQRIVVFGAGTAGTGITDQIKWAMETLGLSSEEANKRFWLIDRNGLLMNDMELTPAQVPYARDRQDISDWEIQDPKQISLLDTITNAKPTILIGCSAVGSAFTRDIIETMARHVEQPIIFPLSNPTDHAEATPSDLYKWTKGKAIVASGSPFAPISYEEQRIEIGQCNNALVFPGIGLGVIAVGAKLLTEEMLWVACEALRELAPVLTDPNAPVLPNLDQANHVAKTIALAVAKQAIKQEIATKNTDADLKAIIDELFWHPNYCELRKVSEIVTS